MQIPRAAHVARRGGARGLQTKTGSSWRRADDVKQDEMDRAWRQRAVSKSLNAARTRAENRVQGLLDAAFALIDERGTTEFTIQEVVDRSKQSLRGFYQYFDEQGRAAVRAPRREHPRVARRTSAWPWSPNPSRSSGCAPSPSGCTSGASRRDAPQARRAQPRSDLGVLDAARAQESRAPDRGDDADVAHADRAAQGGGRGRLDPARSSRGAPHCSSSRPRCTAGS